jgi:hypothetical protein
MVGDIVGYALIKNNTKGKALNLDQFEGELVRALEINEDTKCVLVINAQANEIGMFDFEDVQSYFKCSEHAGILMPPDLDFMQKFAYFTKVMSYPQNCKRDMSFIKKMVIASSIHRGKFTDTLYFTFASEAVTTD